MVEKRRSKRIPVRLELTVSKLFKQAEIEKIETAVPITVTDVSRDGIGFRSRGNFPVGYYFNAKLELGDSENILFCVVQIIRKQERGDDEFAYGCTFIGLASVLNYIFDDFEREAEENGTI
ncbi:MAG: PilZ domain-containing protein [Lachnospiraceae bacterium]|nr:PilZ domain-containing protein [Lachnospiraceae bacterium]